MAAPVIFLTDEVDALLKQAEERLRAKAAEAESNELALTDEKKDAVPLNAALAKADKPAEPEPEKKKKDDLTVRIAQKDKKDKDEPDNAGPDWYGIPKTNLTAEAKRDFQVLRMRGVVDTKQHFRKDNRKNMFPQFSAFGTIVDDSIEGRRANLTRKERRRTMAEEILASEAASESFKKRYSKIQEKNSKGKKGFYKKLVAGRRKRR